jgi:hypothetical protein
MMYTLGRIVLAMHVVVDNVPRTHAQLSELFGHNTFAASTILDKRGAVFTDSRCTLVNSMAYAFIHSFVNQHLRRLQHPRQARRRLHRLQVYPGGTFVSPYASQ